MAESNIKDQYSHEVNILANIFMVIWGGSWAINPPDSFLKPTYMLMFHYKLMTTKSNISLSIFIIVK
jgi:hypothetical protein